MPGSVSGQVPLLRAYRVPGVQRLLCSSSPSRSIEASIIAETTVPGGDVTDDTRNHAVLLPVRLDFVPCLLTGRSVRGVVAGAACQVSPFLNRILVCFSLVSGMSAYAPLLLSQQHYRRGFGTPLAQTEAVSVGVEPVLTFSEAGGDHLTARDHLTVQSGCRLRPFTYFVTGVTSPQRVFRDVCPERASYIVIHDEECRPCERDLVGLTRRP